MIDTCVIHASFFMFISKVIFFKWSPFHTLGTLMGTLSSCHGQMSSNAEIIEKNKQTQTGKKLDSLVFSWHNEGDIS